MLGVRSSWGDEAGDTQALHPKAAKLVQHERAQTFTFRGHFQGLSVLEHCPLEMGWRDSARLPRRHFVFSALANEGLIKVAQGTLSIFSTALGRI